MTSTPRAKMEKPVSAKLVSVRVAVPRIVMLDGEEVSTGIFKTPVLKRVPMGALNLDGDRQANLSVHGGRDKTVFAYPSEHYAYWKRNSPGHRFRGARSGKI
jgi:MOSC domain-containing protein YiiM